MALATTCLSKLTLYWRGPFVLCSDEVAQVPDALAGVYVLSAFVPSRPVLTPFYAGQSRDVRRRLGEHLGGQRTFAVHLRTRLSTYFSVAMVCDPDLRSAAEAALIRRLRPAGNGVVPRALAVAVSLPSFLLINEPDGSSTI